MEVSRRSLMVGGIAAGASGLVLGGAETAEAATMPTLSIGARGAAVTTLQTRLVAAKYWLGTVDGSFGPVTQQAVYAIQKAGGLKRDGVCGSTTWALVNAGHQVAYGHSAGDRIEIDKSQQVLKIIVGGKLVWALNTSTGGDYKYTYGGQTYTAHTPTGSYKVWYVYNGMQHGRLGDLYRPRYFNGGIAVHGSGSIPPYPASHGCCRVSNAAMDMIWAKNYMPMGRKVYVGA